MIYAVNRLTKEHRVVEERYSGGMRLPCRNPNLGKGWDYIQADADGWIEWTGGECPLPKHQKCEHIMRFTPNSDIFHTELAGHLRWTHENLSGDIIAYRPILPQPASEEPKEWSGPHDGLPPVGEKILVRKNDNDWLAVEVVAHDDGGVVYRDPATTDHGYKWAVAGGIRQLPSPREQWVEAARKAIKGSLNGKTGLEIIHDAIANGELPLPEKTQ
ncbi:hypothetical protein [Herbaspirillum sp.]|jgi:hypothetical protein|uniref:hypothetical protein n=1 Tax=Herbaspirillum sp. TaxID=1890675 RepID=UPI000C0977F9|nr:hypothetical protein [Herbaspirillum sp.]MAF06188.1 hypothetical protein [Herbaspirillum sp.]|tara:strand:+ start:18008 stop:18655 length:648 start_codon:yes stop_codon:yes gene_type:complete